MKECKMNKGSLLTLVAMLALVFGLAIACGGGEPAPAPAPAAPAAAPAPAAPTSAPAPAVMGTPRGSVVSVTATLSDMGFDSAVIGTGFWIPYHHEIFEFPLDQNPDASIKPHMAKSWEVSSDGLTWTFEMRDDGVKFHNGMSFTAEDAAWSWERTFNPDKSGASVTAFWPSIDDISSEGSKVIWKSSNQDALVPLRLGSWEATSGTIQSKRYFESVDIETFRNEAVGTGPYKLIERSFGDFVKMSAFEDYWNEERRPGFMDLTVRAVPELSTRLALLKTGAADLVEAGMPAVQEIDSGGFTKVTNEGAQNSNIWCAYNYDWKDPFSPSPGPCGDIRVRRAVSIAIDHEALGDALYFGLTEPLKSFRTGVSSLGYPHDLELEPFNPELAKQLLQEAGFGPGNELTATIYTYVGDADWPDLPTFSEGVAGFLNEVGIETAVQVIDWTLVEENTAEYKASGGGFEQGENQLSLLLRGDNPSTHSLRQQMSEYLCEGNPASAACDASIDEKLFDMQSTFEIDEYARKMQEFNKYMYENRLTIPLLTGPAIFALSDRVESWSTVAGFGFPHNHWSLQPSAEVR
jgi:peptide/nickel transport system substrate-binding protein